jgi:hypothetical protein
VAVDGTVGAGTEEDEGTPAGTEMLVVSGIVQDIAVFHDAGVVAVVHLKSRLQRVESV